jgi:hypothetical protein
MDEHDVRKLLGEPDEIISRKERMLSRVWLCSSCNAVTHTGEPIPTPAPCIQCGGIAFKVPSDAALFEVQQAQPLHDGEP